jgi:hypothetical protein
MNAESGVLGRLALFTAVALTLQAGPQSITGQVPLKLSSGMSIEGVDGGVLISGSRSVAPPVDRS